MLTCSQCQSPIPLPAQPVASLTCPSCGRFTPVPVEMRALLVDANQDGVPDLAGSFHAESAPAALPSLDMVPSPPRRPSPRARKLLLGYQGSQGVLLSIGLIFMAMGLPMGVLFTWGLPMDVALSVAGRTTEGVTTGCDLVRNVTVNDAHPTRTTFTYHVDGQSLTADSSSLDPTCKVEAPVQVQYLPGAPTVARVEGTSRSFFGFFGLFTLIFPVVGAGLAYGGWRSNEREKRAYRLGVPLYARVTFQGLDHSTKVNGRHPHVVKWTFDMNGKPYTGSYSRMDPIPEMLTPGQVLVVADRKDPTQNALWVGAEEG